MNTAPFVRAVGRGPAVVCLHASGGASRQWDALAPVVAAEGRVHLVGHSYGAAVAVRLALAMPGRVASLSLFEPVLFRLLLDHPDRGEAGEEIVRVASEIRASLDAGQDLGAARLFYDFWSGKGAWEGVEPAQRERIAGRMPAVMGCFDALFADDVRPADLARLPMPVLLMSGTGSPADALGAVRHLAAALPRVHRRIFPGMGHMGPVTHAAQVNGAIAGFLAANGDPLPHGDSRFAAPPFAPEISWRPGAA